MTLRTPYVIKTLMARRSDYDQKQFIGLRNNFIKHLTYEVERLNREADWADFNYTELEAEVEVDPIMDLNENTRSNRTILIFNSCFATLKGILGFHETLKIKKSLINAILKSKSHAFLIIGDPGSGKTVSLRHLFLKMADICKESKKRSAILPIYLNLKELDIEPNEICANKIDEWVLNKLRAGQDRTIHEFIDNNFNTMLREGNIFFLFDSFDEIPAVIDADEEQEVVRSYAKALDDFLHSQHQCRGLVSSRPYRAPKTFMGQKMTIRPLSDVRIRDALFKYMGQESLLANKLWMELFRSRLDILQIARNPFYLALLAGFVKDKQILPDRHYDLFEHFVQTRSEADKNRLLHFGLTPSELVQQASILAFSMTMTNNIGLNARLDEIGKIADRYDKTDGWNRDDVDSLINALCYSKLGRMISDDIGSPKIFSFVHRRFHEYFCARYIKQQIDLAPIDRFAEDDRWREVLVLLCEVLPADNLMRIFDLIRSTLSKGEKSKSGSFEHKKTIESIRFLRDGFRSRISDIPQDIRLLCASFIKEQFKEGNSLDQKRATEAIGIVDDESIPSILESALSSTSPRVRETAIQSCRILRIVPQPIAEKIREYIYFIYNSGALVRDYATYSVLFSSPPSLNSFRTYLRILLSLTFMQFFIITFFIIILFPYRLDISILFIINTALFLLIQSQIRYVYKYTKPLNSSKFFNLTRGSAGILAFNSWITYWIILFYCFIGISAIYGTVLDLSFHKILIPIGIFTTLNLLSYDMISNYPPKLNYPIRILRFLMRFIKKPHKVLAFIVGYGAFLYLFSLGIDYFFKAWDAFVNNQYSILYIYNELGILFTLILVFGLLISTAMLLSFAIFIIIILKRFFVSSNRMLMDQFKLRSLTMVSDRRPNTTDEAIKLLHSFKSDWGREQYAKALLKWMPIGEDPKQIIEEANNIRSSGTYSVYVTDALYALAESWEDSVPK